MNDVKLFIFDFDGTALGGRIPYDMFPDEFCLTLDQLSDKGILWATNTTWGVDAQFELINRSAVKSSPAILSGGTGQEFANIVDGKLVLNNEIMQKIAKEDRIFRAEHFLRVRKICAKLIADNLVKSLNFNQNDHSVISFWANDSCKDLVWQNLVPLLDNGSYYVFEPGIMSKNMLLPYYMNKGSSVRIIQQNLGINARNTIVAGDDVNDRHMFDPTITRYMICPANAHPSIKKIVESNNGIIAEKKYSFGLTEAIAKMGVIS